jgi:hypothetical protein
LAILLWGLFWDRPRGRRRCPKCWYDLTNAPPAPDSTLPVCPECGFAANREKQLKRTRRRLRPIPACLLTILVGYELRAVPRIIAEGWTGAIPTAGLVFFGGPHLDPSAPRSDWSIALETCLSKRREDGTLWSVHEVLWLGRLEAMFGCAGRLGVPENPAADPASRVLVVYDTRSMLEEDWDVLSAGSHCGLDPCGPIHYQMPMDDRVRTLRNLITAHVATEDWVDNGGDTASIDILADRVVIAAPVGHQNQVAELLRLLREPALDPPALSNIAPAASSTGLASLPLAVYDVADFRQFADAGKPDLDVFRGIQDLVTGSIATDDWVDNGGDKASLSWWRSKMVVRAAPQIHTQIQDLLAKLRSARPAAGR